jgi:hypothetical protein
MITITLLLAAAAAAPAPTVGIDQVKWLAGCWESTDPARGIEEQWMAPRGGTMLGAGRTVRDGRLIEYELVLIKEDGGRLAYEAHPSGQPSAVFPSKEVGPSRVVFENLEHDFPQRVGYELSGEGVNAWIEGTANGKTKHIDFPYRRAACGGSR